jgi:hypothetical protein
MRRRENFLDVVRMGRVNAQSNAGMNRHSPACCRGDLFGLDIECLPHFAEAARLEAPVADD